MCRVKGGLGGLPPSKRVRCVSEISFAMGGSQFTISSNDYFTASCILATGETLVFKIKISEKKIENLKKNNNDKNFEKRIFLYIF